MYSSKFITISSASLCDSDWGAVFPCSVQAPGPAEVAQWGGHPRVVHLTGTARDVSAESARACSYDSVAVGKFGWADLAVPVASTEFEHPSRNASVIVQSG